MRQSQLQAAILQQPQLLVVASITIMLTPFTSMLLPGATHPMVFKQRKAGQNISSSRLNARQQQAAAAAVITGCGSNRKHPNRWHFCSNLAYHHFRHRYQ
jgi:hypothetical protein